jgi:DNA-binding Lrp family transcriptional regulator
MAIGVAELTHAVKEVENQRFQTFETYLIATIAYLVCSLAIMAAGAVLNRRAEQAAVDGGFACLHDARLLAKEAGDPKADNRRLAQPFRALWRRFPPIRAVMDDLDERLVTLLRHDARRSVSDLAAELGVSRATVRARMERLERAGEILGYTVILRSDGVGLPVRGVMTIAIEGQAAARVIRVLGGLSEVSAVHTTNGRWDLVVELGAADLADFDSVLRRIRLIPGVTASETSLLLATPRSTKARL